MKNARVLVTGASGFVGRWTLEPLRALGAEVHAVQRRPWAASPAHVPSHTIDLHDHDSVLGLMRDVRPTHLLHLAWTTTPATYLTSLENTTWVQTSLHLVRAFLRNGGTRVVMAGTVAEYDWTGVGARAVCSEERTPRRPATLYGVSKHAVHEVLERWSAHEGFSWAHGRLFWIHGPGESRERLVPSIMRACAAGRPFRLQFPKRMRDYLHVSDAAAAFVALVASDVRGAVNVGSGDGIELERLGHVIGKNIGRGFVLEPTIDAPDPSPAVIADVGRLGDEVGWAPRYRLEDGIAETVAWWKAQGSVVQA